MAIKIRIITTLMEISINTILKFNMLIRTRLSPNSVALIAMYLCSKTIQNSTDGTHPGCRLRRFLFPRRPNSTLPSGVRERGTGPSPPLKAAAGGRVPPPSATEPGARDSLPHNRRPNRRTRTAAPQPPPRVSCGNKDALGLRKGASALRRRGTRGLKKAATGRRGPGQPSLPQAVMWGGGGYPQRPHCPSFPASPGPRRRPPFPLLHSNAQPEGGRGERQQ